MLSKDSYLVGLIGSGIGPSLSPALHEREADRQGLRYLYRIIDIDDLGVPAEAVGDLVRAARDLGFDGLNITHPCKRLVIEHLDALDPQAEALGAVNTVVFEDGRAIGHNTDVTGFAASFACGLPDAPLERVVQLGAGGAGAAVAHAMLTLGAGHVTVADALPERAVALAAELNRRFGAGRAAAAGPDQLAALVAACRRGCACHTYGYGGPPWAAASGWVAASRAVGGRGCLPAAGDRVVACRSWGWLRHVGWGWHGCLPSCRCLPAVHRAGTGRQPDAGGHR